ncbi:MAG: polyphosphate--glucose phosphotransferase [Steroidobacteraceae bacterium]
MATLLTGLDFGGSSIKGGVVDVDGGRLTTGLESVRTPQPSTPDAVVHAVRGVVERLPSSGPIGFAYPGVVKHRRARTTANIDASWLGVDGAALLEKTLGRPTVFLNDADAAGIAEMRWGAGRGARGVVIMLTFGTGIGSAIFLDGELLPNTEFGHVEFRGADAEEWASARVRTALNLDFPTWIGRVNEYLAYMHRLFWPDLFILGGAVSERFDEFAPLLKAEAEVRPAHFAGQAGVIGAALAAAELLSN